jgi:hypothetical protein
MDPIADLREFRSMLVAARRREVRNTLGTREANKGEGGEGAANSVRVYQEQIEAIDRAIADEMKLANEKKQLEARHERAPEPPSYSD